MKTLLVLRHAKSSWKEPYLSDFMRPLNKRGKSDGPRMGTLIAREDLVPDLIISSSAKRALSTAKAVALACGYEEEIEDTDDLYHAGPWTYVKVLRKLPDEINRVMIVGHNPGIEEFVEELIGDWVAMPTAALAQISLPIEKWSKLEANEEGSLVQLWVPKELP